MGRIVHFEVHADDFDRAELFYSTVLGWSFQKWPGATEYVLITTGPDSEPGINGGLFKRMHTNEGDAVIAYVCTASVENVDETVAKAVAAGGRNVVAKMAIKGVGWMAYCKDTEGNIFGVMQSDPAAA